jgi:hypothetical protein
LRRPSAVAIGTGDDDDDDDDDDDNGGDVGTGALNVAIFGLALFGALAVSAAVVPVLVEGPGPDRDPIGVEGVDSDPTGMATSDGDGDGDDVGTAFVAARALNWVHT